MATLVLLTTHLFYLQSATAQESPFVLLLSTHDSGPYSQTAEAFKENFTQFQPQAEYMYHLMESAEKTNGSHFVSKTTNEAPSLIFSLGTGATQFAQNTFPDTPVLSTMILQGNTDESKTNHKVLMVQFPVEVQLQWLQKFLPQAKRVGILFNPDQNSKWIREAKKAARGKDMEIVEFEVTSAKQLQAGLKFISRNADVLLAIPDQTVYSGKTAKKVLLSSYRNRIPFVGLSASWVKAGALYALGVDYNDLGRQAAEIANDILAGKPSEKNSPPDKIAYTLNTKTMDHLRLEINNDLIKGAAKVFE